MFDPWIILIVDRTKLGGRIWAVREPTPRGIYSRRTADLGRALRFASEAIAGNALKTIQLKPVPTEGKPWVAGEGYHPGRLIVARAESADLPRPRPDAPALHQLLLFPLDGPPVDPPRAVAAPEPPAAPKARRRRAARPVPTPAGWTLPEQGRSRYHYFAAGSPSSLCLKAVACGEHRTAEPDPARLCKPCRLAAARIGAIERPARRAKRPRLEVQTTGGVD